MPGRSAIGFAPERRLDPTDKEVRNVPVHTRCPDSAPGFVFEQSYFAGGHRRLPGRSPAGLGTAVTASSASCSVSSSPEFTVSVSWSKLPVQRIVLWHSLGDRSYTETLNHQSQKGTVTVLLGFEPVLAVLYDRAGMELARATCT